MKVLIAGDYVPRERIASMMQDGDFSYFDDVKKLTKQADLSILNLEAPIVINDAKPIEKCGPNLKTSQEVVDSLKYAGFDMVTMANNHIMDYGEDGLNDTMNSLTASGIKYVGVGKDIEEANRIEYFEKDGKKLAIINCCEHEFSIASDRKFGANPLNPIRQFYSIQEAKKNADNVLVIIHGGHEHWQLPSPRMVETYRFFVDAGADAVINHHQHCFSGYETYKEKPIFYGLGNLCFEYGSRKSIPWNYGFLVSLEFNDDYINFRIYPYEQCSKDPIVRLLDETAFDSDLSKINDIISDKNLLQAKTNEYYDSSVNSITNMFAPFGGRILNGLRHRGLLPAMISKSKRLTLANYINCESHRDKVYHWFSKS